MTTTIAKTTYGEVRGQVGGGVSAWKGVPYAAPPVGPLRFKAPRPHPGWTGVREASSYGPASIQAGSLTSPKARLGAGLGEDCLHLNVWSPAADDRRRPVMVWIHGGAYTGGSGALYDGSHLARQGDVVVVSLNYRLGVLGFVDLGSATGAEVDSNLGIRDMVAALEWVRDNIAAFGGDPDRVTVAGESAGSVSISLLMTAPSTVGLFRSAILESGSYSLIHGEQVRRDVAARYAAELGVSASDPERLWSLTAAELLAAQVVVDKASPGTVAAAPWFDGDLVPASLEAARASRRPEVALLAGHNHDEVALFQALPGDIMPTTRARVADRVSTVLGAGRTAEILAAYADTRLGNRALCSDFNFAMPTVHLAERHAEAGGSTHVYRFDAGVPWLGATHACELSYLWEWGGVGAFALRGFDTRSRRALAARMRQHWLAFVTTGSPGGEWPSYDLVNRHTRVLDVPEDRTERDPFAARRLAWAGEDVMPRS